MNEPQITKLPAPLFPSVTEILQDRIKQHEKELEGLEKMAEDYRLVCACIRNHSLTNDTEVRLHPTGIIIRIYLSHNDFTKTFAALWKELYLLFKRDASPEQVTNLTGCSWGTTLNATAYRSDGCWLDYNLDLPTDGCRDLKITTEVIPTTTTRYIHTHLETPRGRDWYKHTSHNTSF